IQDAKTQGQPVEALQRRLDALEGERQSGLKEAERRLSEAKARTLEPRKAPEPVDLRSRPGGAVPSRQGSVKPVPAPWVPVAPVTTSPSTSSRREEIVVDAVVEPEVEFTPGQTAPRS